MDIELFESVGIIPSLGMFVWLHLGADLQAVIQEEMARVYMCGKLEGIICYEPLHIHVHAGTSLFQ